MNSLDPWALRFKRKLERAGFKVTLVDPAFALERKKPDRRRDLRLLETGRTTPRRLQIKNSVFSPLAKQFRIVDYGGLNGT
jgi:transposase